MKLSVTFLIIVILTAGAAAGDLPQGDFPFLSDYTVFYNPETNSPYVEIYFGLYRHQIGFIGSDTSDYRYAGVYLNAAAFDSNGTEVNAVSTYFLTQVKSEAEELISGVQLNDLLILPLPPGEYVLDISVLDNVSKRKSARKLTISVPAFGLDKLTSSGLELAYRIQRVSKEAAEGLNPNFIKYNRLVIPNPLGMYLEKQNNYIYVYSELYGLAFDTTAGDTSGNKFKVQFSIKDSLGNVVKEYSKATYRKGGTSAIITEMLDIRDVSPGVFLLTCEAVDASNDKYALSIKPFAIAPQKTKPVELLESDVQLMVNIAYYHLSEGEKIQVKKLNLEGKKNFIKQFWRSKDDDPSNPDNPVYNEAVRRFVFANERYSTRLNSHDGWKSDRGRVYITYGPYDFEDSYDLEERRYPYAKWTYHDLASGHRIFIFVNDMLAGIADYRLVHSTHPREKYDPSWQQILDSDFGPEDDWRDPRDDEWRSPTGKDK
ncbi:MAG: GWxTD domain-containing protein [candidate division Zixibacteria bacterium]|nr:GWxTD domain-containing protein [candidate division Zixibacteria bacterium]